MKKLSGHTLRVIGWAVIGVCFAGGIALGLIFRTPDHNLNGDPIMVMDIWLTLCTWLFGGLVGAVCIGKGMGRR